MLIVMHVQVSHEPAARALVGPQDQAHLMAGRAVTKGPNWIPASTIVAFLIRENYGSVKYNKILFLK